MSDDEEAAEAADAADETTEADHEEPAAEETEAADEEDETTGFQSGDFVELEYTVETLPEDDEEEGRVVDTTSQEVAEEAGIDDEEYDFEPRTIQIGEGHVFASVDEDLQGKEVGSTNTVTVPPAEAFGEFDPDEVRTVTADKIPEDDRYPGAQVTIDGDQGYLETIIGGRARVDFNHPLAGDTLEYEYEVVGEVTGEAEQAKATLAMYLQDAPEVRIEEETVEEELTEEVETDDGETETQTTTEEVEQRTLYIEATPMMQMNQQWMFSKQQIATQLMDQLGLDRVVVEEVIDGSGGGPMGGMMGGGMGGMGGLGGGEGDEDEIDVDAEELVEELEDADAE